MDDETIWPREIWATEIDSQFDPTGYYYRAEVDGGHRYVDGDIYDSYDLYARQMFGEMRQTIDRLEAEIQALMSLRE